MKWQPKYTQTLLWILAIVLFCYTIARATLVSITHDEAFTFTRYAFQSYKKIADSPFPHIPNNHILNTLLLKGSGKLFGNNMFNVRLPNLLFHAAYLVFSILWLKHFKSNWVKISGFILLNINVYLLDFFALARGYGIGVSLLFMSMYFLFEYSKKKKRILVWLSLVMAALAVYANFTFLYSYFALLALFNLLFLLHFKNVWRFFLQNLSIVVISAALAWFVVTPIEKISGDFFGGDTNFFQSTIKSLAICYLYIKNLFLSIPLAITSVVLFFIGLIFYIYKIAKSKLYIQSYLSISILMLSLVFLIQMAQHSVLGTPFITHRTAILYLPLFFVFLICLLDAFIDEGKVFSKVAKGALAVFSGLALVNSINSANIKYACEWEYDAYNEEVLQTINELRKDKNVQMGITWLFEPGLNFYKETKRLDWLTKLDRESLYQQNDYYLVSLAMNPEFTDKMQDKVELIESYSEQVKLFKRVEK